MATKAVILGTNLFPPLILYWYKIFKEIWYDEVDRVYISISQPCHKSIARELIDFLSADPKIEILHTSYQWPKTVSMAASIAREDLLFIPHDDTFIFKPGVLTKYFDIAKNGLVVTPIHNHYHPPYLIDELMQKIWPDQLPFIEPETGRVGYSFFCNFFFVSKELVNKTTVNMDAMRIERGQYCQALDFTPMTTDLHSDVQFQFGLELLKAGARFNIVKKNELADVIAQEYPLDELTRQYLQDDGYFYDGWLHLQSIGFNMPGMYFDLGEKEALEKVRGDKVPHPIKNQPPSNSKVSYWSYAFRQAWLREWLSIDVPTEFQLYYKYATSQLSKIERHLLLSNSEIEQLQFLFHQLIWRDHESSTTTK